MIKQENCRKTSASLTMLKPFVDHNKICGKFLELGIPEHLTCLLRNLYAGQEAMIRTRHGTMDWFKLGKGVHQSCILSSCLFNCILSSCLFNLYADYIIQNVRLDESQAGTKIAQRNINNLI